MSALLSVCVCVEREFVCVHASEPTCVRASVILFFIAALIKALFNFRYFQIVLVK
ncbi:unnamed protein product [Ixodes pacificus]